MWLGAWGTLLGHEKLHRKSWVVSRGKGTPAGRSWGLKWKQWQEHTGILAHLCLVSSRPSAGAALGFRSPPDGSWEVVDPGHKNTQVRRRTLRGTSDVTCRAWLRSLCRFSWGNWLLDKFAGYSAHKQVAGQRLCHQASWGSAMGDSLIPTIQVLRFLCFHRTWCFIFLAFLGSCCV